MACVPRGHALLKAIFLDSPDLAPLPPEVHHVFLWADTGSWMCFWYCRHPKARQLVSVYPTKP